jgi:outer membrane lipoprotein-sorting protein
MSLYIKEFQMKKTVMAMALFLADVFSMNAQDAASIMQAVKDRIQSDTVSTRSRMVITAKNGTTTERVIDQYSKDGPNVSRLVIVFQRPANVAGTRFLSMDTASGNEDRWIYLPSLGKVRRIAASESGGSFMGTDFSYDDMSSLDRAVNLDTHTILREESLGGSPCHVIQSIPRDTGFQYSKSISWIDKNRNIVYKREAYDRRGNLVKVMEVSDYQEKQGRLTPL